MAGTRAWRTPESRAASNRRRWPLPGSHVPGEARGRGGFTVLEALIALLLFSVVLSSLLGAVTISLGSYARQRSAVTAEQSVRAAELTLTTVLRSAGADPLRTGVAVFDPDPLGNGRFDNLRVALDFNPPDGDVSDPLEDAEFWIEADTLFVRWGPGAVPSALAAPVTELRVDYFDRTGAQIKKASLVKTAVHARVTLVVPSNIRTGRADTVTSRVHFRNALP